MCKKEGIMSTKEGQQGGSERGDYYCDFCHQYRLSGWLNSDGTCTRCGNPVRFIPDMRPPRLNEATTSEILAELRKRHKDPDIDVLTKKLLRL